MGPFTAWLFMTKDPKILDIQRSSKIHLGQWLQVHCLMSVKIKDMDSRGSMHSGSKLY